MGEWLDGECEREAGAGVTLQPGCDMEAGSDVGGCLRCIVVGRLPRVNNNPVLLLLLLLSRREEESTVDNSSYKCSCEFTGALTAQARTGIFRILRESMGIVRMC